MNDDKIEQIKSALREVVQLIAQRGLPLSKEVKTMLVQAMEHTATRIQALRSVTSPTPDMETPIPTGAELLWILAGGKEEAFVNYLRTYPDPSLNSLLQNPSLLQGTIARLTQQMPQGERGEQGGITQAPIESSNIYGFNYNPKSGSLLVRFQSGSVYGYQGVPPGIFNVFKNGAVPAKTTGQNQYGKWWQGKIPSLGAAFYQMIRQGNYPYQRLS